MYNFFRCLRIKRWNLQMYYWFVLFRTVYRFSSRTLIILVTLLTLHKMLCCALCNIMLRIPSLKPLILHYNQCTSHFWSLIIISHDTLRKHPNHDFPVLNTALTKYPLKCLCCCCFKSNYYIIVLVMLDYPLLHFMSEYNHLKYCQDPVNPQYAEWPTHFISYIYNYTDNK